jgi:hypothetical protein
MKILLDIDGVMVTTAPWKPTENLEDGFPAFNKTSVLVLNRLLDSTNSPTIGLTTSHKDRFTIDEWVLIFKKRGIYVNIEKANTYKTRFEEILSWVEENDGVEYIIIDDDIRLGGLPKEIKSRLIYTDSMVGLVDYKIKTKNESR